MATARTRVTVRVTPRASCDEILGLEGNILHVRLKSPPVEGAANQSLAAFLAKELRIAKTQVVIVRGHSSRTKLIEIIGLDAASVIRKLRL